MTREEARARWICCPMCDKKKCERDANDCDVKKEVSESKRWQKRAESYVQGIREGLAEGEKEQELFSAARRVLLDKIRAEIEQLRLHKAEFLTNDNKVCIDSQEVLDIIDKHITEK